MADLKTLSKLIKIMRKQGLLTLKHADFDLSLSPEFFVRPKSPHTIDDKTNEPKAYTEQDALFWSSAGLPETDEASH